MVGASTILSIKRRLRRRRERRPDSQRGGRLGADRPQVPGHGRPRVRAKKKRESKLGPFKPVIDAWLAEDRRRRPKQRQHTARRAFDRLVAECGYDGGYTIVQKYVKERKAEAVNAKDASLDLGLILMTNSTRGSTGLA